MSFNLQSVVRTRRIRSIAATVYGPGKIGKTSLAASMPAAIGILTEDGMSAIDGQAFPLAISLDQVYEAIGALLNEPHEFKSVFVDSLDWLEPLIYQKVCAKNNWKDIETPGYGRGYVAAADEWRLLLSGLTALRVEKGMNVMLLAHDKVKRFEDPLRDGYDVYGLKLHDRAAALVQEWSDIIGFATYRVFTRKEEAGGFNKKETKAIGTGERLLCLEARPSYAAGNRFGLPAEIPLSWTDLEAALTAAMAEPIPF